MPKQRESCTSTALIHIMTAGMGLGMWIAANMMELVLGTVVHRKMSNRMCLCTSSASWDDDSLGRAQKHCWGPHSSTGRVPWLICGGQSQVVRRAQLGHDSVRSEGGRRARTLNSSSSSALMSRLSSSLMVMVAKVMASCTSVSYC